MTFFFGCIFICYFTHDSFASFQIPLCFLELIPTVLRTNQSARPLYQFLFTFSFYLEHIFSPPFPKPSVSKSPALSFDLLNHCDLLEVNSWDLCAAQILNKGDPSTGLRNSLTMFPTLTREAKGQCCENLNLFFVSDSTKGNRRA